MQHVQELFILRNQRVAVPVVNTSGSSSSTVMTLDVETQITVLREGCVTIDGRRGWVVQSYPPLSASDPVFFLYRWLDQPDVPVW